MSAAHRPAVDARFAHAGQAWEVRATTGTHLVARLADLGREPVHPGEILILRLRDCAALAFTGPGGRH